MSQFPRTTWRLLLHPPAHGAWNMAVDEAILEEAIGGKNTTTLRLYSWKPPCLSLGYAQPLSDIDLERLQAFRWDLVRRPTGGRAILHTDELTYSVIGPQSDPRLAGGVLESYQVLAQALLRSLRVLAVPAESSPNPALPAEAGGKGPVCFEVPSNYEITVDGKKLVGSAQARRREGVLQHGSLPLYGDLSRILQVLAFDDEDQRDAAGLRLVQRAATLESIIGYPPEMQAVEQAFIDAFQETLNVDLLLGELSSAEITRAEQLVAEKYSSLEWNARN
jgi:lipoate-protein ligase A